MSKYTPTYKTKRQRFRSQAWLCMMSALVLCTACIEELDTSIVGAPNLVINGQFNNSLGLRQLYVEQITEANGTGERLAASGSIYKDGQASTELFLTSNNFLVLPPDYTIEPGSEYFAEVTLPDGQVFRSIPQLVAPPLQTDSMSFRVLDENPEERQPGAPIVPNGIEFFAHIEVPKPGDEKRFYRWVIDESWSFVESNQRDSCFVRESIYENPFTVFSNTSLNTQTGEIKVPVLQHPLDKTFAFQHYINAYLHTIDAATFEYYQKVNRLSGSNGTFYDEVPGPLDGNVFNAENPEERVSGWIEFFVADTFRFRVKRRDIRTGIVPKQCDDVPGGGPCPPDPQVPCQCLACDAILGEETLTPPAYWVD